MEYVLQGHKTQILKLWLNKVSHFATYSSLVVFKNFENCLQDLCCAKYVVLPGERTWFYHYLKEMLIKHFFQFYNFMRQLSVNSHSQWF